MNDRVLVIAAHPDDEVLGCGGTVIRHKEKGDVIESLIVCESESLRYKNALVNMDEALRRAAMILGISKSHKLNMPDQKLDTFSLVDIITPIEKVIESFKPNIIYVQSGCDLNRDHRIVFEAASIAFRPVEDYIRDILAYYVGGSTDWATPVTFHADTWIDITKELDRKIEAMKCYKSELRQYPHPRSERAIRNIAHYMGNQCCLEAAEAFMTIRRIER